MALFIHDFCHLDLKYVLRWKQCYKWRFTSESMKTSKTVHTLGQLHMFVVNKWQKIVALLTINTTEKMI